MTPVEQIKSRLSVVDVVSAYLKLIRAGTNFKAVCPFHSERTPSFFVSPARDVWHCFGCGVGGDQFQFVMRIEGIDFREALRLLAERAGVELRNEKPQERDERAHLFGILELAAKFYEASLKRYPKVMAYLVGRGVTNDTIQKFRLGYAPPETMSWRAFTEHALQNGYKLEDVEKAGVAIHKQSDSNLSPVHYYDRFRNRIMFPVADANGRIIGFGGRIYMAEGQTPVQAEGSVAAKYINTPQTPLYDKSGVLYAFDKAKVSMRKENTGIVVEGYMDAIMAHQAGTEHAVAVSGTALTQRQLVLLRRLCDTIVFSFDMDSAGEFATRRSIDLALDMGFDVKALSLPLGKDPADLVVANSVLWRETVAGAVDVVSYFLEKAQKRHDSRTLEGKRSIAGSVLPLVARLPREVDKAHWVTRVASALGVREESVWQDVVREAKKQRAEAGSSYSGSTAAEKQTLSSDNGRTRLRLLEERMLGILLTHTAVVVQHASEDYFPSEDGRALYTAYKTAHEGISLRDSLGDERLGMLMNRLVFETEMLVTKENALAEFEACAAEFQRERVKEKLEQLTVDIRKAEEAGNSQQVSVLAEEFSMLSRDLTHMT